MLLNENILELKSLATLAVCRFIVIRLHLRAIELLGYLRLNVHMGESCFMHHG